MIINIAGIVAASVFTIEVIIGDSNRLTGDGKGARLQLGAMIVVSLALTLLLNLLGRWLNGGR